MSRRQLTVTAAAALVAVTALSGCQDEMPSGPDQPGQSSGPAGGSTVGADGADSHRQEHLTDDGGYVVQGSKVSFVYRSGVRYSFDAGQDVGSRQSGRIETSKGVLTLNGTSASWLAKGAAAASTVDGHGAGTVIDRTGVIVVLPNGTTTCANSKGLQLVGSDGSKGAVDKSGYFYTDKDGKKVSGGDGRAGSITAGRYTVCNVGDTVSVDLFSDVMFEYGKSELTPTGKSVVLAAANTIRQDVQGKAVNVLGHTDSKGSMASNQSLGMRRASAVSNELTRLVPSARVSVDSAGETQPIAANAKADGSDNPTGRAKNRRVQIWFSR